MKYKYIVTLLITTLLFTMLCFTSCGYPEQIKDTTSPLVIDKQLITTNPTIHTNNFDPIVITTTITIDNSGDIDSIIKSMQMSISLISDELVSLKKQVTDLNSQDYKQLIQDMANLNRLVWEVQDQILTINNQDYNKRYEDLRLSLVRINNDLVNLSQSVGQLNIDLDTKIQQDLSYFQMIADLQKDTAILKSKVNTLQSQCNLINLLISRISDLERKVAVLESK